MVGNNVGRCVNWPALYQHGDRLSCLPNRFWKPTRPLMVRGADRVSKTGIELDVWQGVTPRAVRSMHERAPSAGCHLIDASRRSHCLDPSAHRAQDTDIVGHGTS